MKLGNPKNFIFFIVFLLVNNLSVFAADKIESVPLINLEELKPSFEEEPINQIEDEIKNNSQIKNKNQTRFELCYFT